MVGQHTSCDHPTDEIFERMLLNQAEGIKLEKLRSHILGCGLCFNRVEDLQNQITATKLALEKIKRRQVAKAAANARLSSLRGPVVSSIAVSAVLILGLFLVPKHIQNNAAITRVSLSAYRDSEHALLPQGRAVHVTVDAADLPDGPVLVEIVNPSGFEIWKGDAAVFQDNADFVLPRLHSGPYLLRLYAPAARVKKGEILREFVLHVK
jgi:hypothetical protein